MQIFDNIWNHPRTSAMGLLLGVVTVAGSLSQQGVTLGHAGTGTLVSLASGLATALLGLLARDPGQSNTSMGSTAKLGAWMLIALLIPLPWTAGCTKADVAQQIVNWTPALDAAVTVVNTSLSTLDSGDKAVLATATKDFDVAAKTLEAQAKAYLANKSASTLAQLQASVVALEQQVNTSLLAAAKIKNAASQQKVLTEINTVGTAVLAILALVQSVSSSEQVASMATSAPVKLAQVSGWMNPSQSAALVAQHYDLPQAMARQQVAQAEDAALQVGF
jgi:hypothetical protein